MHPHDEAAGSDGVKRSHASMLPWTLVNAWLVLIGESSDLSAEAGCEAALCST